MTLISHDHQFIFLKTRKTAGTSAEMYLQPFCTAPGTPVEEWGEAIISGHGIVGQRLGKDRRAAPAPEGTLRDMWFSHQAANDIRAKLGAALWDSYRKITVVRNPFAKVLSGFFWRNRNRELPDDPAQKVARFRQTVQDGHITDDGDIVFVRAPGKPPVFAPDEVLRAETLGPDLQALADRMGLDTAKTSLPVTKSSGRAPGVLPLSDWYDATCANIVRDRLDWMFQAGDYSREVPQ